MWTFKKIRISDHVAGVSSRRPRGGSKTRSSERMLREASSTIGRFADNAQQTERADALGGALGEALEFGEDGVCDDDAVVELFDVGVVVELLMAVCGERTCDCTTFMSVPRSGTYLPFGPGPHRVARLVFTFATRTEPSASTVTLQARVDLPTSVGLLAANHAEDGRPSTGLGWPGAQKVGLPFPTKRDRDSVAQPSAKS
jgi:hypothetical protein